MTDLIVWATENIPAAIAAGGGVGAILWKAAPVVVAPVRGYLKDRKDARDKAKEAAEKAAQNEKDWRTEVINQGQVMAAWAKATDTKMTLFQETLKAHGARTLVTAEAVHDVRESVARIEGFIRGMSGSHGPMPTPPHATPVPSFGKPRSHT